MSEIDFNIPTKTIENVLDSGYTRFSDLLEIANINPSHELRGKDLRGVDFALCNLDGFDFSGADLRGANFRKSVFEHAIFDGADVRGAAWDSLIEDKILENFDRALMECEREYWEYLYQIATAAVTSSIKEVIENVIDVAFNDKWHVSEVVRRKVELLTRFLLPLERVALRTSKLRNPEKTYLHEVEKKEVINIIKSKRLERSIISQIEIDQNRYATVRMQSGNKNYREHIGTIKDFEALYDVKIVVNKSLFLRRLAAVYDFRCSRVDKASG